MQWHYNVNFHPNPHKKTPHSSPVRASYGASLVNITSDPYFASVIVVSYAKSCYVGACYNGTQLYMYAHTYKYLINFFLLSKFLSIIPCILIYMVYTLTIISWYICILYSPSTEVSKNAWINNALIYICVQFNISLAFLSGKQNLPLCTQSHISWYLFIVYLYIQMYIYMYVAQDTYNTYSWMTSNSLWTILSVIIFTLITVSILKT